MTSSLKLLARIFLFVGGIKRQASNKFEGIHWSAIDDIARNSKTKPVVRYFFIYAFEPI